MKRLTFFKCQEVQSESDFMLNFSISPTCGFAFGDVQERVHIRHLKGW